MLDNLKEEVKQFYRDLEENIKNPGDLMYAKERSIKLLDLILDGIKDEMDVKDKKIDEIINKQKENEVVMDILKERLDTIYSDIYEDEEDDFSISCPYCNFEFEANIDESLEEIKCPECGNTIELDWNGNPNDDENSGCGGNCSKCGGCE